ncbi:Lrp/AsnC family transcriptional regulator [Pseudoclavibacter sp. Z016]|uniref:Lrp/AsnC family transcriptional regulator n=1 Tax=Pseudoclavibacter sp. Z016 TaxID=2080581 RepID=UPI000CE75F7B|nr:Lrp/AsnC family transcriptional regulator [Pseudoclavibacter sp. Z016]PPF74923.1 AsnC family transcriptional regulator [Pseudoclavibacter sp. Z016]
MDDIDREILSALQSDARLTVTALAARVNTSLSSCHRRLRELERSGAISGYHARLDPAAVGLSFQALLFITMRESATDTLKRLEGALQGLPEVIDAQRLFGDPDYMVRVATRDLESFQRLYDEHLGNLPGVQRFRTTLVMKDIVSDRPLPMR